MSSSHDGPAVGSTDPAPDEASAHGSDAPTGPDASVADPSPRAPSERLVGIDVARGIALLGIFLVNIDFFALPLGAVAAPATDSPIDAALRAFVQIFCEGKFYPLFSLLFGAGLVFQMRSVERAGGAFVPLYLRRVAILAAFGIVHAFALWYGDILFMYSLVAVALLLVARRSARTLAILGVACWLVSVVVLSALSVFAPTVGPDETRSRAELLEAAATVELERQPLEEVWALISEPEGATETLIDDPRWLAAEIQAYQEGPYLQALGFRVASYGFVFVIFLFGGVLDIFAMFALGAAMVKANLFDERNEPWLLRLVGGAMLIGLPGSALAVLAPDLVGGVLGNVLHEGLRILCGPFLSAGYLAAAILIARSGWLVEPVRALAMTGRMALSNYILQTVVATFVLYHWGLGLFATLGLLDMLWLVGGVFFAQVLWSRWWLAQFRFGPLEWVWRSLTYARRQPMRRA